MLFIVLVVKETRKGWDGGGGGGDFKGRRRGGLINFFPQKRGGILVGEGVNSRFTVN